MSEAVLVTNLAQKQRTFCIWFKLICGKFIISAYLFHYSLHLTDVLIPNIFTKNSSGFFFIRVEVCCKCQNNVQCSVIPNCFYKLFSPKENRVKKMNLHFLIIFWRYIFLINVEQRCFNVVLRCKFQRWHTQRCFNVDLTLCDVATSYQPKNNVEPTLKCLLGRWCHVRFHILYQIQKQLLTGIL